jgi:hypothetical protein
MKNLYNQKDQEEILHRINQLTENSQRQWGKMDPAQMLAHCHTALETAAGLNFPPRIFIGRIIARFMKAKFLSEKIFDKNYPTDKSYRFTSKMNFETEKSKIIPLINTFCENGKEKCTSHPHSFYGKLTPEQWGIAMYKHFDHHLRQFGV